MSNGSAEVLGRIERRRRFSVEQKMAVLYRKRQRRAPTCRQWRAAMHSLLPAQVYKWRRPAELGVIGVPGASELPSFVAVEIAQEVASLPMPAAEAKPTVAAAKAPRRQRRSRRL